MNITMKLSGPMFTGNPDRVISKAVDQVLIAVAKAGVNELKAELSPGHGQLSGAFKRGITRRKRGKVATVFARNTMIAKWLEGGSSLIKRSTRFRGYQIFAPATQRTDRTAGEEARHIVAEITRQLGGR